MKMDKVETVLGGFGIHVYNADSTGRAFAEVINDISRMWGTMSEKDKWEIATAFSAY